MLFVLIVYFVALAIIAISSARHVKGIPDFFVARKGASTTAVAGSLIATILGGSAIIGAIDAGPTLGGAAAWFMLTGALGLLALLPLTGRAYKLGKYSLPDLIENMYGKGPRATASIVIPLAWTGIVAAQIIAGAKLLQNFAPVSYHTSAVIVSAIFILYTIAGGQHSILRTDFFQAVIILVALVTLAGFCFYSTSFSPSLNAAAAPGFPFNENFTPLALLLLLLTYGTTFTAGPDMFSRIFCAKDIATAKKSIAIAAAILVPVATIIGYLAACGSGLQGVQGTRITALAQQVLPAPLLPLIAIALLSVVLSSADTLLLSSSVIVCEQFVTHRENRADLISPDNANSLAKARVVILVNGIVALLIALHFTDIIGTLLLALAVYAGAFTIPVLWGLAGLRSKPKFVGAAIIAGGAIALIAKVLPTIVPALSAAGHSTVELSTVAQPTSAFSAIIAQHLADILTVAAFAVNAIFMIAGRISKHQ